MNKESIKKENAVPVSHNEIKLGIDSFVNTGYDKATQSLKGKSRFGFAKMWAEKFLKEKAKDMYSKLLPSQPAKFEYMIMQFSSDRHNIAPRGIVQQVASRK